MKLSLYPQETREKFSQKYWYDLFYTKYQLQGVTEKYFEYIDTKSFVEMSEQEWCRFSNAVESVNQVFLKAYHFYLENLEKNLPDFMPFHAIIRSALPLDEYAIGRYDILVDQSGEFRFLETNANTPGMTVESHYPAAELCPPGYRNISENLIKHLQAWVLRHAPKGKVL
jgi:glutathionylspermidine synthase